MDFYISPLQARVPSRPQPHVQGSKPSQHARGALAGSTALWALCLCPRSRCAVSAEKQERTKRKTQRRDAASRGFREAQPVVLDEMASDDDMERDVNSEAEDLVWREQAEAFQDIFLTECPAEKNIAAHDFLFRMLRGYFKAAISSQIGMLVLTWCEENKSHIRLSDVSLDGLERLEEPLCWRSIPNEAGLDAFAADVIVWTPDSNDEKETRNPRGSKASKSRGFSDQSMSRKETRLATRFTWIALKLIIHDFSLISGRIGNKPRILIPQGSIVGLKKIGVKDPEVELGIEMCTYSGKPRWEQLVSDYNSLVVVFLESPVSPDLFWSLPADMPNPDRTVGYLDTSPVLLLSIQQLEVKFNVQGIMKKLLRWIVESEVDDIDIAASKDDDIFAQWTSMLPVFGSELNSKLEARRNYIRSKLGKVVRKVFANKRAKLRAERLPQLVEAQQRKIRQLRRQRELRAQADIIFAELEEAIRKVDFAVYEKKIAQVKKEQLFEKQKLLDVEKCWAKAVRAVEVPLRDVVQSCTDEELEQALLVLPRLEEELAASPLPMTSLWLQAALDLRGTLQALRQLQCSAEALESGTSSSTSELGDQLVQLSQDLRVAEARVDGFDLALRKARGVAQAAKTEPFQRVLKRFEQVWKNSKSDQKLLEVLNGVPWERSKRLFAGVTAAACERLQAAANAASIPCKSRMKDALEEAFTVADVAKRLRRALEGTDELAIVEVLKEAEQNGLLGLDGARQHLSEMQTAKSAMREELTKAASRLDVVAFELHAGQNMSSLPKEELQALRVELQNAIEEEERMLQEVLTSTNSKETYVREALRKCRLLATNPWRRVAQASIKAMEAAKGIREVLALVPVDETMLQASLSSGSAASKELNLSLEEVQELQDQGELKSPAFEELQRALDEGYLGLAGAQKDQSLESLLHSPPWREPHWEVIQPSDLRQLELRVQEASKAGQERLAQEVQRALEVGQCAVDLSNAVLLWDLEKLEKLHSKASELRMLGLEKVQAKMQRIVSRRARSSRSAIAPKATALQSPTAVLSRTRTLNENQSALTPREYEDEEERDVRCQNLIFMDLELTSGFYDFEDDSKILEVAVIVTDKDMDELDRGHWVLGGFSRQDLESLGDFHKANFRDSKPGGAFPPLGSDDSGNGLFSDVIASRLSLEQVESEVMELIERHCPVGECPLVGYSVQCDREVIKDKMPRLYRHLSHQIIDVSGFFTVARYWLPDRWQDWDRRSTTYNHRALNDAEDSVEAMRWVRKKFFAPDWAPKKETKQFSTMKV